MRCLSHKQELQKQFEISDSFKFIIVFNFINKFLYFSIKYINFYKCFVVIAYIIILV